MKYKTIKFRDACKLVRGISYKSSNYTDENDENGEIFVNLKCVMPNGFRQDGIKYFNGSHKENQYVNNGDLLIANTDLTRNREVIGNSILVPEFNKKACFSMDLTKIEITDESILDRMYLYYYLKSPKARWFMINHSDGSTVVHLSTRSIPEMDLEIPDLETQKKIVRILSALDQKIELNNQQNKTIEKQASALVRKCINGETGTAKLKEITSFDNGFAFKSKDYVDSGKYKVITIKNVQDGLIDSSSAQFVTGYPKDMRDYHKLSIGDVLLSLTGNVGRVGIVFEKNLLLNQRVAKVKPEDENLLPFLYFLFRQKDFKQKLEALAKGTAQLNLSPVETLECTIPYSEQSALRLSEKVKPLFEKIIINNQNSNTLSVARDIILPKLMSGEINLDGIDI